MEWLGPQVTICYISVLKKPDKTQLDLGAILSRQA